jgi:hypothetical protein
MINNFSVLILISEAICYRVSLEDFFKFQINVKNSM